MSMSDEADPRRGEPRGDERHDQLTTARLRAVFLASAVVLVLILALPVLTSFTSVLDGVVGGIGVAYIVGFGEFVLAMAGAVAYCRWVNRLEAEPESTSRPPT
jgi:uncharacterized membrane protein (DUF485 family)